MSDRPTGEPPRVRRRDAPGVLHVGEAPPGPVDSAFAWIFILLRLSSPVPVQGSAPPIVGNDPHSRYAHCDPTAPRLTVRQLTFAGLWCALTE